jgi:transcriptional regulator with XRE-family HTH domain
VNVERPFSPFEAAVTAEIRAEAAAQRMSWQEIAKRAEMQSSTLSRYLSDQRHMSVRVLADVSLALGLKATDLIERAERRLDGQKPPAAEPASRGGA